MQPTIYAAFPDAVAASKAIEELVRQGHDGVNLTLVCKNGIGPAESVDNQDVGGMPGVFPDLRAAGPGGFNAESGTGTRYAGIAASANASTDPGGMTDFLWDSLPTDMAKIYQKDYDGGLAIIIVREPSDIAERILREQGALNLHHHGFLA